MLFYLEYLLINKLNFIDKLSFSFLYFVDKSVDDQHELKLLQKFMGFFKLFSKEVCSFLRFWVSK